MIKHIVAWNLQEEFAGENAKHTLQKMKEELENLRGEIPQLIHLEVEIQLLPTSNRSIVLQTLFASKEDLQKYQIHPAHQKVAQFIGSVACDRVCLDYEEA